MDKLIKFGEEKTVIIQNSEGRARNYEIFCTCGERTELENIQVGCPTCGKNVDLTFFSHGTMHFTPGKWAKNEKGYAFSMFRQKHVIKKDIDDTPAYTVGEKEEVIVRYNEEEEDFKIGMKNDSYFMSVFFNDDYHSYQLTGGNPVFDKIIFDFHQKIAEVLFKAKGIVYKDSREILNGYELLWGILPYLKNPLLQHLPFNHYGKLKEDTLDRIKKAKSTRELWVALTHHKGKRIRNYIGDNIKRLNSAILWGPAFKKPDNLLYFLQNVKESLESSVSDHEKKSEFSDSIQFLKKVISSETTLVKKLVAAAKELDMNSDDFAEYVNDIYYMYERIIVHMPEYQPNFNGSIIQFHDALAKDSARAGQPLREIEYSENEKKFEEKLNEEFSFVLPKDTHEIIDVGTQMNICVGSYAESAANKNLTIITLLKKDVPLVCLELSASSVRQAKLSHNRKPDGEIKEMIIHWANSRQLDYQRCSDLV